MDFKNVIFEYDLKQAGSKLGQAQLKLRLDFTLIKIWCNKSNLIVNKV